MTETGMTLGTPHYMSPEQAMGEREITARSDVYALGCVTYEMLTGEPPFTGPTAQAIVAKVMTEEPRSLDAQRETMPPDGRSRGADRAAEAPRRPVRHARASSPRRCTAIAATRLRWFERHPALFLERECTRRFWRWWVSWLWPLASSPGCCSTALALHHRPRGSSSQDLVCLKRSPR